MATGIAAAARSFTPGPPALQFLVVPLGDALIFGVLVGLALYYRRRFGDPQATDAGRSSWPTRAGDCSHTS
ncbi:MAG TPA: hypothetical protein VIG25_18130 [Pyrinomonadaceae bacterium]